MSRWRIIVPTVAVLSVALSLSLMRISCFDVWWHIESGRLFLRDGLIPHQEIFSYTASGKPWVDGYLLAQAVIYIFWLIGGPSGISVFGGVLVTASFSLALAMSWWGTMVLKTDSRGVKLRALAPVSKIGSMGLGVALLVSLPAIYATAAVMLPRPALLTPLFALITLWILEDWRINGGKRIWWTLPLMVLWANCHPAFLLGPMITGVYFLGALVRIFSRGYPTLTTVPEGRGQGGKARASKLDALTGAPPYIQLAILIIGQLIVVLINPYGYKVYYSALSLLSNPELRKYILEWNPLFSDPPEWPGVIPAFLTVAAFGLISFIFSWKRTRIEHLLLFVVLAVAAIAGRRNRLQFGPMSIVLISWTISQGIQGARRTMSIWRFFSRKAVANLGAVLLTLAALAMTWFIATDRLFFYERIFQSTGLGVNPNYFPDGAVKILEREPVKGNIFHDYSLGGYMIFALYPKYKVFIDGRIYPYPMDILFAEDNALKNGQAFENVRLQYDVRAVFLHLAQKRTRLMAQALLMSNEWTPIYLDEAGALFLMKGVGNDDIIARYGINIFSNPPDLGPVSSKAWFPFNRVEYPHAHFWWAGFYDLVGRPDLAAQVLKPVLEMRPTVQNTDTWYGSLLIDAGESDEGFKYIQQALAVDKNNIVGTCASAEYWISKNDLNRAEEILADIMMRGSATAEFWRAYGELQLRRGNMKMAEGHFRKSLEYRSNDGRIWEKLGISLEKDDISAANEAFRHALALRYATGAPVEEIQRIRVEIERTKQ